MRERLIEILNTELKKHFDYVPLGAVTETADKLLKEGVIVPPMMLGQTCFEVVSYRNEIDECRVSSITQKVDGTFKIRLTNICNRWVFEITSDEIGKSIFLTKEEAEQALKGGEG